MRARATLSGVAAIAALILGSALLAGATTATTPQPQASTRAAQADASAQQCGGVQPPKEGGGNYVCTFSDDFLGKSLDPTKWVVQTTEGSGFTTADGDCYVDSPGNVRVDLGKAILSSRMEAQPFVCQSPYGNFITNRTAGSALTYGRFAQTYGLFEFRARFPGSTAPGVHSALWMYPIEPTYGPWPASGEIDVVEWFSGAADGVYPSVHYAGENVLLSTGYNCKMATAGSAFHNYAVEWTSTSMRFFYDGALCHEQAWLPTAPLLAPQPFDRPFDLIMTQGFGHGSNAMTDDTSNSATMYVDWVRAWQ